MVMKFPNFLFNNCFFPDVTLINRIANVHSPMPMLVQDDSTVAYCNATHMPEKYETAMDGKPIAYCPHLIELKLGKVYEFLLVDDDDGDRKCVDVL